MENRELVDLRLRLKDVITGVCNKVGCDKCGLKYNATGDVGRCSATDLEYEIETLEVAEMHEQETSSDMDYLHETCKSDMKQIVAMKTFMEEVGVLQAWERNKSNYLEEV